MLPSIVAYAKQIGKPALDAELGMIQSVGDAKFVGGPGIYGLQMSRAQFYDRIYSLAGVQGFVLWNLGCGLGPGTYDVNPKTPATWNIVKQHGLNPDKNGPPEASFCP